MSSSSFFRLGQTKVFPVYTSRTKSSIYNTIVFCQVKVTKKDCKGYITFAPFSIITVCKGYIQNTSEERIKKIDSLKCLRFPYAASHLFSQRSPTNPAMIIPDQGNLACVVLHWNLADQKYFLLSSKHLIWWNVWIAVLDLGALYRQHWRFGFLSLWRQYLNHELCNLCNYSAVPRSFTPNMKNLGLVDFTLAWTYISVSSPFCREQKDQRWTWEATPWWGSCLLQQPRCTAACSPECRGVLLYRTSQNWRCRSLEELPHIRSSFCACVPAVKMRFWTQIQMLSVRRRCCSCWILPCTVNATVPNSRARLALNRQPPTVSRMVASLLSFPWMTNRLSVKSSFESGSCGNISTSIMSSFFTERSCWNSTDTEVGEVVGQNLATANPHSAYSAPGMTIFPMTTWW